MAARKNGQFVFSLLIAAAIFLLLFRSALALDNAGFESGDLTGWETYSGSVAAVSSEEVHGGSYSALVENSSIYSYGIQQVVTGLQTGQRYRLSGYVKLKDEKTAKAMLRIAWYESSDGSGSQKSTQDSEEVISLGDWSVIILEVTVPNKVASAKFRAVLSSKTNGDLAGAYFDDLNFELLEDASLPTPTSTPTPVQGATPTSSPSTATCQINEVKNNSGQPISSVKVYVDGVYLHHYAPETLTFCDGCSCDGYTACGFGEHRLELEKNGYQRWSETKNFQPGESYTINAVLLVDSGSGPNQAPTPTKKPTPTTLKSTATPTSSTPTPMGEVLGETQVESDFYPLKEEAISEGSEKDQISENDNSSLLAKLFFGSGMVFLFSGGLWGWYTVKEKGFV